MSAQAEIVLAARSAPARARRSGGHPKRTGRGPNVPSVIVLAGGLAALAFGTDPLAIAGYGLCAWAFTRAILLPDRPLPIRWLIVLVAALQWVVAPSLAYAGVYTHSKYQMYVPSGDYMALAVPGVLALACGLIAHGSRRERAAQTAAVLAIPRLVQAAPLLPFALMGVSLAGSAAAPLAPAELGFVAYLAANLKYSAAILFLLSDRADRLLWVGAIFALALIEAAAASMFHDVVLWSALIGVIAAYRLRASVAARIGVVLALAILAVAVQGVKSDYRASHWGEGRQATPMTYVDLTADRLTAMMSGEIALDEAAQSIVLRANQGWIISRIIANVPAVMPYANGETVIAAIQATLVPRLLSPGKAIAGGRENFTRFTGLALAGGASMGTSVLGEAYGNFGWVGSAIFMLAYGLGLAVALDLLARLALTMPIALVFVPNVLLYAVKAETDLVTVINYVVKSGVFHLALVAALVAIFGVGGWRHGSSRIRRRISPCTG